MSSRLITDRGAEVWIFDLLVKMPSGEIAGVGIVKFNALGDVVE
jgi:hypothetical protein